MDLTSPKTIKEIAARFGFSFKKGLGQNFLTDKNVLLNIVDAVSDAEGILEIGPGFGVLTYYLAKSFKKVVAVEMDAELPKVLDYTLSEFDNTEIVLGDILKTDVKALLKEKFPDMKVSVAANLPYYVTTPIISMLLTEKIPVSDIVIMIQKEVAERICAKPGTKAYGALSVMCQYYSEPSLVCEAKAEVFVPAPKVDSQVVKMTVREYPPVITKSEDFFFKTVQAAFSQRRKTLLNCLSSYFKCSKEIISGVLADLGIDDKRRGETLSLEEFATLSDRLLEIL